MRTQYPEQWQYKLLYNVEIKPLVKNSKNRNKRKRKAIKKSKVANRS